MKESKYRGFNPPMMDEENIFPFQINLRLIKNDIIQLLQTIPGERVMDPEFGAGLQLYLFELLDQGLETTIKNNISDAITRYDDRIDIKNIIIEQSNKTPNLVTITIIAVIKEIDTDLTLKFSLENRSEG